MIGEIGKIAVIGSGSWATALAKLILGNSYSIGWYIRKLERIDEFIRTGHNPTYLTDVTFDTSRIQFSSDINEVCEMADTIVVAVPSPYFKGEIERINVDISGKNVVSAVKGIVPEDNEIVTDYFIRKYGCGRENMLVIGGPCHAEEVALSHLSYLTIGCHDLTKGTFFASNLSGEKLKTIISPDVEGIEYGAVLKNVYAIAAGIVSGMKGGDNFLAMLVCNAVKEMHTFIDTIVPMPERDITRSAYLGDLLVTSYSRFSRNHNFGAMIGKGYSVKAVKMEMQMVAEGYYGVKCIRDINNAGPRVDMPILEAVYRILYENDRPRRAISSVAGSFV